ncbi:MAG: hypothetical protein WCS65_07795 [Verrucomicrobiae bacterium]
MNSNSREVSVEEQEDRSAPVSAYLIALRKARRGDCILLPPGEYPAPQAHVSMTLRALRPGTVTLRGRPGEPAVTLKQKICLGLSGITLVGSAPGDLALRQSCGCAVLISCHITGGIELSGPEALLFCDSCHLDRADVGISLSGGAKAEVRGTAISGCAIGIFAGSGSALELIHSRIEGEDAGDLESPGAGLHAEDAPVYCAGTLFIGNHLGVHLKGCKDVEFLFCMFERQMMGGFMMREGGTLHMHGCIFREQSTTNYAHVTLENVTADLDFCEMDPSAGLDVDSAGGSTNRRSADSPTPPEIDEAFASVLADLRQLVGLAEFKAAMGNILHHAHAVLQRRKLGLAVPPLKFHCIFEGPDGSGRRPAAAIFSRALSALGILHGDGKVTEVSMEDLIPGGGHLSQAIEPARGGILVLHAPEDTSSWRDARLSFAGTRETLRQVLAACDDETVLIFSGPRNAVRPVLCNSPETEEMFRATIHFFSPSPPEVAEMFAGMAAVQNIRLTTAAGLKILLGLHMMHDRKDRRYFNPAGIAKLMDAAHSRYYDRCSREHNFDLRMEPEDLDLPVEKLVEPLLQAQPKFVTICPKCEFENPWVPGMEKSVRCAKCGHEWESGWGIWTESAYYRVRISGEKEQLPVGLPARKHAGSAI